MIIKKHIENTIVMLDARYNQALLSPTPQDAIYFSKLAILEYGGWIEESFDVIIKRTVKGKLKTQIYQNIHAKDIIKPNFGFEYKKHFRTMMYKSVGLVATELIEKHLNDTGKLQIFESELDSLKTHRDDAAHTWIYATRMYPSPSVIKGKLDILYPIMKSIYSQVVRL